MAIIYQEGGVTPVVGIPVRRQGEGRGADGARRRGRLDEAPRVRERAGAARAQKDQRRRWRRRRPRRSAPGWARQRRIRVHHRWRDSWLCCCPGAGLGRRISREVLLSGWFLAPLLLSLSYFLPRFAFHYWCLVLPGLPARGREVVFLPPYFVLSRAVSQSQTLSWSTCSGS